MAHLQYPQVEVMIRARNQPHWVPLVLAKYAASLSHGTRADTILSIEQASGQRGKEPLRRICEFVQYLQDENRTRKEILS